MKKLTIVAFLVAFCLCHASASNVFSMETKITWKMASTWPKGTLLQWQADLFADTVNKLSNGMLVISSHPAGAIVGAMEVFDATHSGSIQAFHAATGYWIGKVPTAPFFNSVPTGFTADAYMAWFYEGDGMELMQEAFSKFNFGFVAPCGISPPDCFAWSHKPIKTMEDFKGLKFRTLGYWGEILGQAGAAVVTLPGGEVYLALQRKVVDAAEFSTPAIDMELGFHEICQYLTLPGIHQPGTVQTIHINKKAWENLSSHLQEVVKHAAQITTLRAFTRSIWLDGQALVKFKEYGTNINYLDAEVQRNLAKKTEVFLDNKAKEDKFFSKVLESQRKWQTTYKVFHGLMTPQY